MGDKVSVDDYLGFNHTAFVVIPESTERESALLHDNVAIHGVLNEVTPDDFYHPAHQQLFTSMVALQDANEPVDLLTLANHLNERKILDSVGGHVYLAELFDYEATAANVVTHARIVRDKSVKRGLIAVATDIVQLGYEEAELADRLLDQAESRVFEIGRAKSRQSFVSLHDEMAGAIDFVEMLMDRGGELTGVPTGFKDLDEKTGGLQGGEVRDQRDGHPLRLAAVGEPIAVVRAFPLEAVSDVINAIGGEQGGRCQERDDECGTTGDGAVPSPLRAMGDG